MSETKHTQENWQPSLSSCLHAAMAGGAFVVIMSVGDFNTSVLWLGAAAVMIFSIFMEVIDCDPESAKDGTDQLVKFGKFLIACAFVSAILAVVRFAMGI